MSLRRADQRSERRPEGWWAVAATILAALTVGNQWQDDLTDATRWAIDEGIADPERICIAGGSYGGYAALMGVVREPDLYQCAIGIVGVYSLPMMQKRGDYRMNPDAINEFFEDVVYNLPTENTICFSDAKVEYFEKLGNNNISHLVVNRHA